MTILPTDMEARIRAALNERLGDSALISRFHRHNDVIYLEVVGRLGLERTAKLVQQALDTIGSFLRSEKVCLDVTISVSWQPRWQPQELAGDAPAILEEAGRCVSGRRR
jgi:hypothetical protein